MARRTLLLALLPLAAACTPAPAPEVARQEPATSGTPGLCHAEAVTPAVLDTVTEQTLEVPPMTAPDGTVLRPARFRTVTTTRIAVPREVTPFETPCPLARREPDFVRQIQRALQARGLYEGPDHGLYDAATQAAVAAFQLDLGIDSGILSTEAARALGLVALGRAG